MLAEQALGQGLCAAFPAGTGDGHMLINNSGTDVVYLEVGDRTDGDTVSYPDHDLVGKFGQWPVRLHPEKRRDILVVRPRRIGSLPALVRPHP